MIEELQYQLDHMATPSEYDEGLGVGVRRGLNKLVELKEILEHAQQDQIVGWSEEFLAGRKATLEWILYLIK